MPNVCKFFLTTKKDFHITWEVFPCHDISGFWKFCSGVFIDRKYYYLALSKSVDDQFNPDNRFLVLYACFCERNARE
jgi:hypothetical protein